MGGPTTVDQYLAALPADQRDALAEVRRTISEALPEATESISYRMPVFKVGGRSVLWMAAFRDHYSLYPATELLRRELGDELKPYLAGKGTIRFAADQPIPLELVSKIARLRLAEESGPRY